MHCMQCEHFPSGRPVHSFGYHPYINVRVAPLEKVRGGSGRSDNNYPILVLIFQKVASEARERLEKTRANKCAASIKFSNDSDAFC